MTTQTEGWTYVPGLLQLVEEGVDPGELATRDFMAPNVRSGSGGDFTARERSALERMWQWLKGFRSTGPVVERLPVWAPVAQVWPAADATAELEYSAVDEAEHAAKLTVVAIGGFGGGSRRTLTQQVRLDVTAGGLAYETLVHVTIHRYENRATQEILDCVDVDASGTDQFRSRDLLWEQHPFYGLAPTLDELSSNHTVHRVEHLRGHSGTADVTVQDTSLKKWQFDVGGESPAGTLKLSATCQNTRDFKTVFRLPGGRDYAFVAQHGEAPIVPVCVPLAEG